MKFPVYFLSFHFLPQKTKDVTIAMAEGRFDDAIKLRGKWGMHFCVIHSKFSSVELSFTCLYISANSWQTGALSTIGALTKCWLMCAPQIQRSGTTAVPFTLTVYQSVSLCGKYICSEKCPCKFPRDRVISTLPYWMWELHVLGWMLQSVHLSGSGFSRATRCWECMMALMGWLMER